MNPLSTPMFAPSQGQSAVRPEVISNIKSIQGMFNAMSNPEQALAMTAQNNPQLKMVIDMCRGQNPEQVFRNMCAQRGVNPEDILKQLR